MPAPNIVQVIGGSAKSQQRPIGFFTIQTYAQAITATQATSFALGPDQVNRALSAAAASVASALKTLNRTVSAATSGTATLSRALQVVKSVSQLTSAAVARSLAELRTISAAVSSSIGLQKVASRAVSASNATVLTMVRAVSLSRTAGQSASVTIGRAVSHLVTMGQSAVASVVEGSVHGLTVVATAASSALHTVAVSISKAATQGQGAALVRFAARSVSATAASAVSLPRAVSRVVRAAQSVVVVGIFEGTMHHLSIAVAVAVSVARSVAVAIAKPFTQGQTVTVLRGFPHAVSATVTSIASLTMHAADHVRVSINQAVVTSLARAVSVQRAIVQPSALSLMRVMHKSYALAVVTVARVRAHFVPEFFTFGPDWLVARARRFFSLVRGRSTLTVETTARNWTVATARSFEVKAQQQSDTVRDTRGDS